MPSYLNLFGLLLLGSLAGLLGGVVLVWKSSVAKNFTVHLISFAAGVILATAFLDILPEAIEKGGESTFLLSLIGLVAFFLIEDFVLHFHHHEGHEHSLKSVVPLLVFSDSMHNFVDGIVITASFIADPSLGFLVALATFFHEIPQEVGDFAVLLTSGLSKGKVVAINLLSALSTFLGAGLTLFLSGRSESLIGPLLGLSAGMFLYISSADILPQIVEASKKVSKIQTAGLFLAGILLVFLLTNFIPH